MGSRSKPTVAVVGDGGWGTTLALHLNRHGQRVLWWGAFPENIRLIKKRRRNPKYLPGISIPKSIHITSDLMDAISTARLIVLAVPSQYVRSVLRSVPSSAFRGKSILNVAKGLERKSLKRISQIISEEVGRIPYAVLSGPNVAIEIAHGQPASSVVASVNKNLVQKIQQLFMDKRLRIYTSRDVVGVELGGALKNPVAIAAGIVDGLKFGSNAKAALVTRGIIEISRLGVALGGAYQTFWGLSGLGDLVTTCSAGRNRWLGEQLGRGRSLSRVLAATPMVIEGIETSRAAVALASRHKIELPIIEQVHAILFKGRSPQRALELLMRRTGKSEFMG